MRYLRQDQDRQWLWGKAWGTTLDGVVTIASKRRRGFRMWWHTHNGSWVHMDSRYIKLFMNIINRFCTHRCTLRNAIRAVSPPTQQNKIKKNNNLENLQGICALGRASVVHGNGLQNHRQKTKVRTASGGSWLCGNLQTRRISASQRSPQWHSTHPTGQIGGV